MRDQRRDDARFGAPECAEVGLRDALPALEHGRLPEGERRRVERHVEECAACAAELALLRDVRGLVGAGVPALDLDRIALAVSAATVRPHAGATTSPDVRSLAAHRERRAARARPAWATRLASAGGLRAAAALLVVAVGGAVVASRTDTGRAALPALDTVAVAPAATAGAPGPAELAVAPATTRAPAHALGERFDDLSDDELSRVLVALENEDAALPALEPAVQATEYRGGGE